MVACNKNNVGSSEQRYFLADDIFSHDIFLGRRTRFLVQSQFPELRFFYQRNAPPAHWPGRSISLIGSQTGLSLNHLLNKSFLSSRPVRDMLKARMNECGANLWLGDTHPAISSSTRDSSTRCKLFTIFCV